MNNCSIAPYIYFYPPLFLMAIFGLIGNILIIIVIIKYENLHTPENIVYGSLAVADIITLISYPLYSIAQINQPGIQKVLGNWPVCVPMMLLMGIGLQMNGVSLTIVTIVRYTAISYPLRFSTIVTNEKIARILIVIWICISALSITLYLQVEKREFLCKYSRTYTLVNVVVLYILQTGVPLITMISLYGKVLLIARKQIRAVASLQMKSGSLWIKQLKLIKVTGLLIGYFCVATIPLVTTLIVATIIDREPSDGVWNVTRLLIISNSCVNILIYTGRLPEFKNAFKRLLPLPFANST